MSETHFYLSPSVRHFVPQITWPIYLSASACGDEAESHTANPTEVTCATCRALLARVPGAFGAGTDSGPASAGGATPATDPVARPAHYTRGAVECIDAIDSVVAGLTGPEAFYTAQIIKYVWRWKHKNGIEDLKKAKWYLERLIGSLK